MSPTRHLHISIADHVAVAGTCRPARLAAARWSTTTPALAGLCSPAGIAAAGRAAGPDGQDRILAALLAQAAGDEWAELTVMAVLAPRIGWVVASWVRAGMTAAAVEWWEAELTVAVWTAVRAVMADPAGPPLDRPGLDLVDTARATVRIGQRRQRRRSARHTDRPDDLSEGAPTAGDVRPAAVVLGGALVDAYRAGQVGLAPARALWMTRVAGYPTDRAAELLGTSPATVRAWRSRAATWLTGGAGSRLVVG